MPSRTTILPRLEPAALLSRQDVRLNLLLLVVIAVYDRAVNWAAASAGLASSVQYFLYGEAVNVAAVLSFSVFAMGYIGHMALVQRVPRPIGALRQRIKALASTPSVMLNIIFLLAVLPVFMSNFTSFKSLIPHLKPFAYDPLFSQWDIALHGGRAPWEWTHAVFSSPAATVTINVFYNLWFFVMWGFLFLQLLRVYNHRERMRFMLAFVLCWAVIGSLFGCLLSSAGPCYFGYIVPGQVDPYAPLMARLHAIDDGLAASGGFLRLWSLNVQDMLWQAAQSKDVSIGGGISAMPSLHVAVAVLMALAAFRLKRWFGWVMTAFAVMILIGSVHLGWHYALDGYVSSLMAMALWKLSGWLVDKVAPASAAVV